MRRDEYVSIAEIICWFAYKVVSEVASPPSWCYYIITRPNCRLDTLSGYSVMEQRQSPLSRTDESVILHKLFTFAHSVKLKNTMHMIFFRFSPTLLECEGHHLLGVYNVLPIIFLIYK